MRDMAWNGGTPQVVISEGIDHRVLIQRAGFSSAASLTMDEVRSLHRWLGDKIWSADEVARLARSERANREGDSREHG
jgi:hypothetical protein